MFAQLTAGRDLAFNYSFLYTYQSLFIHLDILCALLHPLITPVSPSEVTRLNTKLRYSVVANYHYNDPTWPVSTERERVGGKGSKGWEEWRQTVTQMSTSASVSNLAKIPSSNICQGQGFSSAPVRTKSLPVSVRLDKVGKLQSRLCVCVCVCCARVPGAAHEFSGAVKPECTSLPELKVQGLGWSKAYSTVYKNIWKHQSIGCVQSSVLHLMFLAAVPNPSPSGQVDYFSNAIPAWYFVQHQEPVYRVLLKTSTRHASLKLLIRNDKYSKTHLHKPWGGCFCCCCWSACANTGTRSNEMSSKTGERTRVAPALWEIVPEEKRCDCAFGAYISYTFA